MAESHDLSLLSGAGAKCRGDQGQKSYEKWSHRGNDDDLTNRVKTCIFNPDGVFGIHNQVRLPASVLMKPAMSLDDLKTDIECDPEGAEEFVALIRVLRKEGSRPVTL